jgi:hypothetical protein
VYPTLPRRIFRTTGIFTAIAALALLAACGTSHSSAHEAASSIAANATVSADLSAGAAELLANLQKDFNPAHPDKSLRAALRATYPQGSTGKIVSYGLKTFTLADVHPLHGTNPVRDAWLQGIDAYAQHLGTAAAGQAAIPGITPSPAASATGSTA